MVLVGFFDDAMVDKLVAGSELHNSEIQQAMHTAVQSLYPFLERNATVLDVGCGWCGPAAMLAHELGMHVTGVTISKPQVGNHEIVYACCIVSV